MFLKNRKLMALTAIPVIILSSATANFAQTPPKPAPMPPTSELMRFPKAPPAADPDGDHERFIKTDPAINLSLCVMEGEVRVNGWNRNEVRMLVIGGGNFNFKVQQKSQRSSDPVWIMAVGEAADTEKIRPVNECLRGDEIEIDAPVGASLNLKGQDVSITVDGIRRVSIKNAGGDISVRNVSDGINATTYRGDLTVEQSSGAMVLENTSGNIVVFDAGPSEIGDIFKAKTASGAISVQKISHRQLEVNSISGSVTYNGDILNGGSYAFWTSNGSIKLTVPASSAGTLTASYAGSFSSDLPYKLATETVSPGLVKSIVAVLGAGGNAALKLTTNNGSISIKKL
jgi:Putative adhesin